MSAIYNLLKFILIFAAVFEGGKGDKPLKTFSYSIDEVSQLVITKLKNDDKFFKVPDENYIRDIVQKILDEKIINNNNELDGNSIFTSSVKGEPGEPGASVTGPRGRTGLPGVMGLKGSKGDNGPAGPKGQLGENGRPGLIGLKGALGPKGDMGPPGHVGFDGLKGEPGIKGLNGTDGNDGLRGLPGPSGPKGERGLPGLRGLSGNDGIRGKKGESGIAGQNGPKGEKGDIGERGLKGLSGVSVSGDKGDRGDIGPPGPPGALPIHARMAKVEPGPKGLPGSKGQLGPIGPKGNQGESGRDGSKGEKGRAGESGRDGERGYAGDQGPRGFKGLKGGKGDAASSFQNAHVLFTKHDLVSMLDMYKTGALAFVTSTEELFIRSITGWLQIKTGDVVSTIKNGILSGPKVQPSYVAARTNHAHIEVTRKRKIKKLGMLEQRLIDHSLVVPVPGVIVPRPYLLMMALNDPSTGFMGGVSGADYLCYKQANALGLDGGTFRAFLSDRYQGLNFLLKKDLANLPVANFKGERIFDSFLSIYNSSGYAVFNPKIPIYSFSLKDVRNDEHWPIKKIWHGSHANGELHRHNKACKNWKSLSPAYIGTAASIVKYTPALNEGRVRCDKKLITLCVQTSLR